MTGQPNSDVTTTASDSNAATIEPIRTALLIDFDSINIKLLEKWIFAFKIDHRFLLKRAYCNWADMDHNIIQRLMLEGIELVQVPVYSARGKKNGVDMRLCIDAVETALLNHQIERFLIFGSDSDYIALTIKLRERNKQVIFVGNRESTSPALLAYCDEFYYLDQIQSRTDEATVESTVDAEQDREAAFALFNKAIEVLVSRGEVSHIRDSRIHDLMKSNNRAFNYKDLGYTTWMDFLSSASAGRVKLLKKEGDQQYVDIIVGKPNTATSTAAKYPSSGPLGKDIEVFCQLYEALVRGREQIAYSELIQNGTDLKKLNHIKEKPADIAREMFNSNLLSQFYLEANPNHLLIKLDAEVLEKVQHEQKPGWYWRILYRRTLADHRIPLDFHNTLTCHKLITETLVTTPAMNKDVALTTIINMSEIRADRVNNHLTLLERSGVVSFAEDKVMVLVAESPRILERIVTFIRGLLHQEFQSIDAQAFRGLLIQYEATNSSIQAELEQAISRCEASTM